MIIQEYPYKDNEGLVRSFSDCGMMILQNESGIMYCEAVDVYPCKYTYRETDQKIPVIEVPYDIQAVK